MWKLDTINMARKSDETNTDYPKGGGSSVPIEMWHRRAWKHQGVGVSEALNIIWEGMLRWQIFKLMRYF